MTKKAAAKPAARLGRPSKYKPEFVKVAKGMAMLGATDAEMAVAFDVSEQTLNTWKKEHPDFLESLNAGKLFADGVVAEKLFQRATGYEHSEDDIRALNGEIVITPTIKHYPPDTTAAIFWLKNRRSAQWRDKPETSEGDDVPPPVSVTVEVRDARKPDAEP